MTVIAFCFFGYNAYAASDAFKDNIYHHGQLKPVDSVLKVKVGQKAPDFTLKAVSGKTVSLKDYRGKKNVVISFVPAAWTPICSDQWPGYNIISDIFESNDAVLLGITTDNIPTLFPGPIKWGNCGLKFYPISGRMGKLRQSSAYCDRRVLRSGRSLLLIRKALSVTLMSII